MKALVAPALLLALLCAALPAQATVVDDVLALAGFERCGTSALAYGPTDSNECYGKCQEGYGAGYFTSSESVYCVGACPGDEGIALDSYKNGVGLYGSSTGGDVCLLDDVPMPTTCSEAGSPGVVANGDCFTVADGVSDVQFVVQVVDDQTHCDDGQVGIHQSGTCRHPDYFASVGSCGDGNGVLVGWLNQPHYCVSVLPTSDPCILFGHSLGDAYVDVDDGSGHDVACV
jgi:hypothetical protein